MRGKLRDKREIKRDRLKHEMMGRRPAKRANRNLHLQPQADDDDDLQLEGEETLAIEKEQLN